jgi:hypothetical protein
MASFIELCLSGDVLADEIDDFIDLWHDNKAGQDQELHEFLGMTWDEYSVWVTRPSVFPYILSARKHHQTLRDELAQVIKTASVEEAKKIDSWLLLLTEEENPLVTENI